MRQACYCNPFRFSTFQLHKWSSRRGPRPRSCASSAQTREATSFSRSSPSLWLNNVKTASALRSRRLAYLVLIAQVITPPQRSSYPLRRPVRGKLALARRIQTTSKRRHIDFRGRSKSSTSRSEQSFSMASTQTRLSLLISSMRMQRRLQRLKSLIQRMRRRSP